jgi:hypothetical protein
MRRSILSLVLLLMMAAVALPAAAQVPNIGTSATSALSSKVVLSPLMVCAPTWWINMWQKV